MRVTIFEKRALVSSWEGVKFINVCDPTEPVLYATCQTSYPMATAVAGAYVFVADYSGLAVIARGNDQNVPVLGGIASLPQVERLAAMGSFVTYPIPQAIFRSSRLQIRKCHRLLVPTIWEDTLAV